MRLAVLSDIHGNLAALEAVLADIEAQGAPDVYWVLGDLAAFCPWPAETVDRLWALEPVAFLQGNTDRYVTTGRRPQQPSVRGAEDWARMPETLRERDANFRWTVAQLSYDQYTFLRDLPTRLEMDVPGYGPLLAVHADLKDDETFLVPSVSDDEMRAYFADVSARLVLYGHTHRPVDRVVDGIRFVNDGSVGLPLDGDPRAAYALIDFEEDGCRVDLRRVAYDVDRVLAALERVDHPASAWVAHKLRTARS